LGIFFYGYRLIGATFSLQFDGFYSRLSYSWMILECARGLTSEHLITIVLLTTAPALSYTCFGLKDSAYDTSLHTKKKHGFKPSSRWISDGKGLRLGKGARLGRIMPGEVHKEGGHWRFGDRERERELLLGGEKGGKDEFFSPGRRKSDIDYQR